MGFSYFCGVKIQLFTRNCKLRTKKTSEELHHATCRAACEEFLTHIIHVWSHMLEENAIACTEIIESWFSVGCMEEAKARTFSVTGLEPLAFAALARESLSLEAAEMILLGTVEHLGQTVLAYIT